MGDGAMSGDGEDSGRKPIPRMDLTCPECGHIQSEPLRVVSTQCRGCLAHYQVRDGMAVARPSVQTRFAKPGAHDADEPPPEVKSPLVAPSKPVPPPMSWWKRFLLRPDPPRQVRCFACEREFTAGAEAESTQCPGCGGYVSLRDFSIQGLWTRELRTRGNVLVQKDGSIHRTSIQCHNLTVYGKITGEVDCSGDLVFHGSGKVSGAVRCRRLHVCRKARVEFLDPVRADEVLIEGEARGVFHCSGTVTLARRALLQGFVRAVALNIRTGASHVGTVDIIDPPESDTPSLADPPPQE